MATRKPTPTDYALRGVVALCGLFLAAVAATGIDFLL